MSHEPVTPAGANPAAPGYFIAFEGGEGAGKSSQIRLLTEFLNRTGRQVTITREPGATTLGRQIRMLLLEQDAPIAPRGEALLFAADRAHHVATVIRPALARGEIVITDRYVDSSLAYQGAGRVLAVAEIRRVSEWATEGLVPDLTVLLDIGPELGLSRAGTRTGQNPDRLERETLEFHDRVRAGFTSLAAAEPGRYLVLDGSRDIEELARDIADRVREELP